LNNWERPVIIAGQFESDKDFIAYVEKEFRLRKLYLTTYFSGYEVNKPVVEEVGGNTLRAKQLQDEYNLPS